MLRAVLPIVFGAGFTVAAAVALGALLLRALRVTLLRYESVLLSLVTGSSVLGLLIFVLSVAHQVHWRVLLGGGTGVIVAAVWSAWRTPRKKPLSAPPRLWLTLFFALYAVFLVVYWWNALAPEVSPDGSSYHLGNVARVWRHHGFDWSYHSLYSYLSQGAEMLYLVAFSFGGHSSAAMVHFAFLAALPLLMACYGCRFGFPRAGLFAGILTFTSPIVGITGISAYNDVLLVTCLFAVFYLLQLWDESRSDNLLAVVGLLVGWSYGIKYTGGIALPFALIFVFWRSRKLQPILRLGMAACVTAGPWLVRNWIWIGNPFAPFGNRWFPNPYFHPGMEQSYVSDLQHYDGIRHAWEIPLQLTLHGELVSGMLGPVFLMAPFALLALRSQPGRRLLAAAAVFAIPAYFNADARFLIPAIPFLALSMGVGLSNSPGVLPALAIFASLVCWPTVLSMYCYSAAWRLSTIPMRAALRLEPEEQFLRDHVQDYDLKESIDRSVLPSQKIFSFAGRPSAYIDRDIVVWYESALGNLANDVLLNAVDQPPDHGARVRFVPVEVRGIRAVAKGASPGYWSVNEMRLVSQGREVSPSADWRFSASPNRAEAGLAFDRDPVTRWSTWEPVRPGDRLQVEFSRLLPVDQIVLQFAGNLPVEVVVEILKADGRWQAVGSTLENFHPELPGDLRPLATRELKARGLGFLWINDSDALAADLKRNANFWGITPIAESHATRLYRLD